jgi:hypothetical protein
MFRLPSAWNIPHSSDECEFSSCDDRPDSTLQPSELTMDTTLSDLKKSAQSSLNATPSTTVLRKRTSSKLDSTLDDSDIETSPTRPIIHQNRISRTVVSRSLSTKFGPLASRLPPLASSVKAAHASTSSIEEIEVDTPTQVYDLQQPKADHNTSSRSEPASGWVKTISGSFFQQHCGNIRSSRARHYSRNADSVLVRQAYGAVQRNRDAFNSINNLLHSQMLTSMHTCEFMLLSVVSCEPCHLPVFPVRVHFCNRKFGNLLQSQCKAGAPPPPPAHTHART